MQRAIFGALAAMLLGCSAAHHPTYNEPPPSPREHVQIALAREVTQPVADDVIGTIRSRNVAAISSSIMGNIRALKVTVGSHVHAGALLVQLSAGEIDAKASQAEALFAQADLDLKRAEQLKASQSISAARYEAAAAQFRLSEAALAEANVMRGYTALRAPFAGVITEKHCNVGDQALPGKPLLVLETQSGLRLEAAVPEIIAQQVTLGEVLTAQVDSIATPLAGTVSELSPSADPSSRTVLVKLDLPNVEGLRAGMFGRLKVRIGEERAVNVPSEAVLRRGQLELVFVSAQNKAQLRIVRTGRSHGGTTEVLSGLDDREPVILSDLRMLEDGQPVEVTP